MTDRFVAVFQYRKKSQKIADLYPKASPKTGL